MTFPQQPKPHGVFQSESCSAANLNKSPAFQNYKLLLVSSRQTDTGSQQIQGWQSAVCSRLPIISGYCFYSTKSLFGGPKYSYVGSTAACKKKMSDTLEWCSNSLITLIPKIPLKSTEERGQEAIRGCIRVSQCLRKGVLGSLTFPYFPTFR